MKLTLSAGGAFTGLTQHHTISLEALDEPTRQALMEYMAQNAHRSPSNYNESWSLDDGREVLIDVRTLPVPLLQLYTTMKAELKY